MEHIIFSLNSVMPVFIVMGIGLYLGKRKILTDDFVEQATTLVFYTALPAKLFMDVSHSNFNESLDIGFTAYLLICTCVSFIGAWILCVLLIKDRTAVSAIVHSAFRGNFVYLGIPVCQSILGRESVPSTIMVVTFVLPFYNVLATIVLSYYDPMGRKVSWKKMLKDILTNPMILAILAALPFSLMDISLPSAAEKALSYLGQLSTPMALILIGAGTKAAAFAGRGAWIVLAAVYKVVVNPLLFVAPMVWLGFNSEQIVTAFVMFAVPSAMNAYILTKKMGGDGELGAAIITVSMMLSAITLPAGILIIKYMGII